MTDVAIATRTDMEARDEIERIPDRGHGASAAAEPTVEPPGGRRTQSVRHVAYRASMRVVELVRYPVKSLAPIAADTLEIEPWGPVDDRRWAVTDPSGRLVTARTVPTLLTITTAIVDDGIALAATDGSSVAVPTPVDGPPTEVNITRLPTAIDAGDGAAAFLTRACGRDLRLVWQPDPRLRSVNPRNGGLEGEMLNLADAGPLLLTTIASLDRLQEWIGDEPRIEMNRFRANIVIDGTVPFDEDRWTTIRIGELGFRVQQPCDRCMMTTIDPVTIERGDEPLRTLQERRASDVGPLFGIRLVPAGAGAIAVGDEIVAT